MPDAIIERNVVLKVDVAPKTDGVQPEAYCERNQNKPKKVDELKSGSRVWCNTIPTAEGLRITVTHRQGTLLEQQTCPDTKVDLARVKWDAMPGEYLVPLDQIHRFIPASELMSATLLESANGTAQGWNGFVKDTFEGIVSGGKGWCDLLSQFREENGKKSGKELFLQWVKETQGYSRYLIEAAMDVYRWWLKLTPAMQRFIRNTPLHWSVSAWKALTKATRMTVGLLKTLFSHGKQTASSIKNGIAKQQQMNSGAEVLVLYAEGQPYYQGKLGVIISEEPDDENVVTVRMGSGEELTLSIDYLLHSFLMVSEPEWEELKESHGITAELLVQVRLSSMQLAERETPQGYYCVVRREQLKAVLKRMGIYPVPSEKKPSPPARPEAISYTPEQKESLVQSERQDAVEQYKREQEENNIRIVGEMREAAVEQASRENQAVYAHREKLQREKEELKGTLVESDNLIARQEKEIEELQARLQLKESANQEDSIGSTSREIELSELKSTLQERDSRIALLGTELEELRSTVLKLQETQSVLTPNQEQDSISSSASPPEESGKLFFTLEEVEARIEKARTQWERARFESQQSEMARLRDKIENEVAVKVMVCFWGQRDKMLNENIKLQSDVLETERKLEQARLSANSLRNLVNSLSKEKELVEEQRCSLEENLAEKEACIAAIRKNSGLVDSELHEGKRIVVRTSSRECKGCLGTVQSAWNGQWWVMLDSVVEEGGTVKHLFKASELGEESKAAVFTLSELQERVAEVKERENRARQQELKELTDNSTSVKTVVNTPY